MNDIRELLAVNMKRKFPKPEMIEQIATALEIDVSTLFSVPPDQLVSIQKLQRTILQDINIEVGIAVEQAINKTILKHIKELENKSCS